MFHYLARRLEKNHCLAAHMGNSRVLAHTQTPILLVFVYIYIYITASMFSRAVSQPFGQPPPEAASWKSA